VKTWHWWRILAYLEMTLASCKVHMQVVPIKSCSFVALRIIFYTESKIIHQVSTASSSSFFFIQFFSFYQKKKKKGISNPLSTYY
jgi:hypothetical protein